MQRASYGSDSLNTGSQRSGSPFGVQTISRRNAEPLGPAIHRKRGSPRSLSRWLFPEAAKLHRQVAARKCGINPIVRKSVADYRGGTRTVDDPPAGEVTGLESVAAD